METIAAIDIGSSSIRMKVCEVKGSSYSVLDELRHPVKIGRDCFINGKISRSTIDDSLTILKKYKKLCNGYDVKKIEAYATPAIRDTSNVDIFIDNIRSATGLEIEILNTPKESEFIYHAFDDIVKEHEYKDQKEHWAIIEIGAGSVELIILEDEYIIYTRSLPLGSLRTKQTFIKEFRNEENFNNFLQVIIEHELQNLKRSLPVKDLKKIYGIGFETEELPKILGKENGSDIVLINAEDLKEFYDRIKGVTEEELIHKFNIPYNMSDTFYTSCSVFVKFIEFFNCPAVYIPNISMINGIIRTMINIEDPEKYYAKLERQLFANSITLGRSMNFDEAHALKVRDLALKIFDLTKDIHNLGKAERTYLLVASLLHDIGSTISYRSHHKHSLYIIKSQDAFSLSKNEVNIIANTARYHRKSPPKDYHTDYISLSHKDRMTVMKLAGILRIADSLDNAHLQLIEDIDISRDDSDLLIRAKVKDRFFSEVYSFKEKKNMFEDFFGLNVILKVRENK